MRRSSILDRCATNVQRITTDDEEEDGGREEHPAVALDSGNDIEACVVPVQLLVEVLLQQDVDSIAFVTDYERGQLLWKKRSHHSQQRM